MERVAKTVWLQSFAKHGSFATWSLPWGTNLFCVQKTIVSLTHAACLVTTYFPWCRRLGGCARRGELFRKVISEPLKSNGDVTDDRNGRMAASRGRQVLPKTNDVGP